MIERKNNSINPQTPQTPRTLRTLRTLRTQSVKLQCTALLFGRLYLAFQVASLRAPCSRTKLPVSGRIVALETTMIYTHVTRKRLGSIERLFDQLFTSHPGAFPDKRNNSSPNLGLSPDILRDNSNNRYISIRI